MNGVNTEKARHDGALFRVSPGFMESTLFVMPVTSATSACFILL